MNEKTAVAKQTLLGREWHHLPVERVSMTWNSRPVRIATPVVPVEILLQGTPATLPPSAPSQHCSFGLKRSATLRATGSEKNLHEGGVRSRDPELLTRRGLDRWLASFPHPGRTGKAGGSSETSIKTGVRLWTDGDERQAIADYSLAAIDADRHHLA